MQEDLFDNIPLLAKWKLLILDSGVSFNAKAENGFGNYPDIVKYKTKFAVKNPVVKNFKVYDASSNEIIIPSEIIITDNERSQQSLVKLTYSEKSFLQLEYNEKGEIFLFDKQKGEIVDLKINLVERQQFEQERLPAKLNPNRPFLKDFVQIIGKDRIGVLGFEGCWHWNTGVACKFCDSNPKRGNYHSAMPDLNNLIDHKLDVMSWWDGVKFNYIDGIKYTIDYINSNVFLGPHKHFQYMSGNMPSNENVWDIAVQISKNINEVVNIKSFDSYINIAFPQRNQEERFKQSKDLGYNQFQFNLEVIGEDNFKDICPGKSRMVDYKQVLKDFEIAVKIFGFGKVRSNFVFGLQDTEELLNGIRFLADKGVVADYSVFIPKRGTPLEKKKSPELREILYFTKELANIYKKYEFKPIYCALSSRSNILHELLEDYDKA